MKQLSQKTIKRCRGKGLECDEYRIFKVGLRHTDHTLHNPMLHIPISKERLFNPRHHTLLNLSPKFNTLKSGTPRRGADIVAGQTLHT